MARLEAGLILIEVDYTSATQALVPAQSYSPYEIGLGRLVNLDKEADFVGKRALIAERDAGGAARRLVGLEIDWPSIEANFEAQGLPIHVPAAAWREQVPIYAGGRQVGRATSGSWSPTLKKHIALASVDAAYELPGTRARDRGVSRGPPRPRHGDCCAAALLRSAAEKGVARVNNRPPSAPRALAGGGWGWRDCYPESLTRA